MLNKVLTLGCALICAHLATGGCSPGNSATGSVTLSKSLNNGRTTIATATGTFTWNGVTVNGNGITVRASNGNTIDDVEWWIYSDRNGNGDYDSGDATYTHGHHEGSATEVNTGQVTFDVGSTDPPPRLKIRVRGSGGTVTVDIGIPKN